MILIVVKRNYDEPIRGVRRRQPKAYSAAGAELPGSCRKEARNCKAALRGCIVQGFFRRPLR